MQFTETYRILDDINYQKVQDERIYKPLEHTGYQNIYTTKTTGYLNMQTTRKYRII